MRKYLILVKFLHVLLLLLQRFRAAIDEICHSVAVYDFEDVAQMTPNRLRDTQGSIGVTLDPYGAIAIEIRHYILLDSFFYLWDAVVVFVKIEHALVVHFQTVGIKHLPNTLSCKSFVDGRLVSGCRDVLPVVLGVQLLHDNVEGTPHLPVIAFAECIEFIVVGPTLGINFGLPVLDQDAPHDPLTIDEAAVSQMQTMFLAFARINFAHRTN